MIFTGIKNIIFDLDGTLIDSSPGVIEATNHALTKVGESPRSDDEIKQFIGFSIDEMFKNFSNAPLDILKDGFREVADKCVVDAARPLDGIDDLLAELHRQGFKMAIATTKVSQNTAGIVEKLGWSNYFAATASGDEVEHVKPSPEVIILAISILGGMLKESLYVGDTKNDVLAARAAGIKVVAVKSDFGGDDLAQYEPDLLLDRTADLIHFFPKTTQ